MKKRFIPILSIGLILILALSVIGCEDIVGDLIAGGGNEASAVDVGDIAVDDDGDYLYIAVVMANWVGPEEEDFEETGWEILDAHAHVAIESEGIPQKKGNPIPGKFDLQHEDGIWDGEDGKILAGGWEVELTEDMKEEETLYIAVHLKVMNDQGNEDLEDDVYESVWAKGLDNLENGSDFDGKNWATYLEYEIVPPEPVELFEEDFTGVAQGEIPTDWTSTHENWLVYPSMDAGGSSPEMDFYWWPQVIGTSMLVSPAIDASLYSDLELTFKHYVWHWTSTFDLKVQVSTDGGSNWTDAWSISPTDDIESETVTVDLSANDGQTFQLAWVFDGDSNNIDDWFIDDILVTGI